MSEVNISVEAAKALHASGQAKKIHGRFNDQTIKASVYGASDGIITTFAVVAGVAGAQLSPSVVIILGVANLIADGISMGISDYLGARSEQRFLKHQYKIEEWEIKNLPEEEEKELEIFFKSRGVSESESKSLTKTIRKYPKLWTELGFIDEMGVAAVLSSDIWKTGLITFLAFVAAGSLPLIPYFIQFFGVSILPQQQFISSILATAGALFLVGSLRTLITKGIWWKNGLEVLSIGAIAAATAYLLGWLVEKII